MGGGAEGANGPFDLGAEGYDRVGASEACKSGARGAGTGRVSDRYLGVGQVGGKQVVGADGR